jgi:hypothetical protein
VQTALTIPTVDALREMPPEELCPYGLRNSVAGEKEAGKIQAG